MDLYSLWPSGLEKVIFTSKEYCLTVCEQHCSEFMSVLASCRFTSMWARTHVYTLLHILWLVSGESRNLFTCAIKTFSSSTHHILALNRDFFVSVFNAPSIVLQLLFIRQGITAGYCQFYLTLSFSFTCQFSSGSSDSVSQDQTIVFAPHLG